MFVYLDIVLQQCVILCVSIGFYFININKRRLRFIRNRLKCFYFVSFKAIVRIFKTYYLNRYHTVVE